jgi:hypothetical protein
LLGQGICSVERARSAGILATLVDVTGLCIYFLVAMLVLRNTLLKPDEPPAKSSATTRPASNETPAKTSRTGTLLQ